MMKKLFLYLVCVCLVLSLCSCGIVTVDEYVTVKLVYRYDYVDVETQLTQQESEKICDIFNGKVLLSDNPSCGFDENISLIINNKVYSPACDDCCIVKDCSSGKYFNISRSERDTIEEIFVAYGGHFPCV